MGEETPMASDESLAIGASREAIRAHYDLSNEFYSLWLDESLTYSCAMWCEGDSLQLAQARKIDYHVAESRAANQARVLDIGCGWGSTLARLVQVHGVESAIGLTLSKAQYEWVLKHGVPGCEVRHEGWQEHEASQPYGAIVCIGALEHFVRPETPPGERVKIYARFFDRCHELLEPGGWMSLQTIAYSVGGFVKGAISSIFPESDLPRLAQLSEALEGRFEVVRLRNDRGDYARTCRSWLARLRAKGERARALVGDRQALHYERFLDASSRGFEAQVFALYRVTLRRID